MPSVLVFGPFRLDLRTYVLSRDGAMVRLSPKLAQVLACLADARGELVTRELLLDRFWPDVNVTDNTLTRAIADIRQTLGDAPAAPVYIQTMARRGYRFVAPVAEAAGPPEPGQAGVVAISEAVSGLEPFVAWERGRVALESLSVTALPAAAEAFSRAVVGAPQYAPAHAGLANAHVFRFEASRVDNVPDLGALTSAIAAATRATQLDPSMGEGWAALGHALSAAGRVEDARAAVRQAVALEPRNWRHHYRMAVCTWGEERLRAVERAEALLPGFPGAQTLAAMVLIARQSFEFASEAAGRGVEAQSAQHDQTLYPASGLLWVRGLTAAARGQHLAAVDDFTAEAAASGRMSTVYARESGVLAHEALGFTWLTLGDSEAARAAFAAAAAASPGHGRATLGLAVATGGAGVAVESVGPAVTELERAGKRGERALLIAAAHAWTGRASEGLLAADQALAESGPDATGWSLPADPMFAPLRGAAGYARLAARLASRAS
jgi:DNA-binding winged helix-turn-helix (wHTH) protein/Flp pilus assembly protein TadD